MDLKGKFLGKKTEDKQSYPDSFEPSEQAKEAMEDAEDMDIKDFLQNKNTELKEREVQKKQKEEKELSLEENFEKELEDEKEVVKPSEVAQQSPSEKKQSNLSSLLTLYIDEKTVERDQKALQDAVEAEYVIGLQAGIQVNKDNIDQVKPMINLLVKNGYLVAVSAEKVEPVL